MTQRRIVPVEIVTPRITRPVTLAVASDLHNAPFADALPWFRQANAVLVPGDLLNRHKDGWDNALSFLREVPKLCPVFYSLGNHEHKYKDAAAWLELVRESDAVLLDNRAVCFGEVSLGGLSSAPNPTDAVIAELERMPGFRLLLCHHPEYYDRMIAGHDIDLTLAGHAHGGQVEIFGRGVYAPGQGFFPRLTHGFYRDRRLFVSRGMTNSAGAPRINNPCELIMLKLIPCNE